MDVLATLGRTLGFSLAAGVNLYATVALVGLAARFGEADAVLRVTQSVQVRDADGLAVGSDEPDLGYPDPVVDAQLGADVSSSFGWPTRGTP